MALVKGNEGMKVMGHSVSNYPQNKNLAAPDSNLLKFGL